jgi:RNA polymerase sigma factor (TIGR02999 family)
VLGQLVPVVYNELRRLAHLQLRGERANHSLQTTALVNEAYVRIVGVRSIRWRDRGHFFAMSARLMRRILVEQARARNCHKRGSGVRAVSFDDTLAVAARPSGDLIALDDALRELATRDPRKSRVVELRFFGGLTVTETARALSVSPETVMRDWRLAKVWLLREMSRA